MRIYYNEHSYIDFRTVTHWEQCGNDWVELLDDDGNIKAVLNWKNVWLMRPLTEKDAIIEAF